MSEVETRSAMSEAETLFPKYYSRFACKAERCTHNCCIGWEIDIDGATAEKYESLDGRIGEDIRKNTVMSGEVSHFLMKNGRCPMLCEDNLCRIIRELGDGALCHICREHPRYYNELSKITLGGVGMSCEAAAELILSETAPTLYGDIGYSLGASCDGNLSGREECDGNSLAKGDMDDNSLGTIETDGISFCKGSADKISLGVTEADDDSLKSELLVLRALSDIEVLLFSGEGALSSIRNAVHRIIDLSGEIDLYLFGEADEPSDIREPVDGLLIEGRDEILLRLREILSELEYMSEGFEERVFAVKWRDVSEFSAKSPIFSRYLLNSFAYLTARHLPLRAESGDTLGALGIIISAFLTLSLLLASDPEVLSSDPDTSLSAAVRLAVLFSEEIEYSEENTERLSELLL